MNTEKKGRKGVVRSALLLAGGSAIGQLVAIIGIPLVTRIYEPTDLGKLAIYSSFLQFATVLAAFRLEVAIVSAKSHRAAAHLAALCVLLILPTSLAAGGVFLGLASFDAIGFGVFPGYVAGIVALSILLNGIYLVLSYWHVRNESFAILAKVAVFQNAVRIATQVGFGLGGLGWMGLIIGDFCGYLVSGLIIGITGYPRLKAGWSGLSFRRATALLKRHREYLVYLFPSSVIDASAHALIAPLVLRVFGAEQAGFFALCQRVMSLPVGLIGRSVSRVFHGRIAFLKRSNPAEALRFFFKSSGSLLLLSLLPSAALLSFGPELFGLAFGPQWAISGKLAQVILPWMIAQVVVSPLSGTIAVYDGHRVKLAYDFAALAVVVVTMMLAESQNWPFLETMHLFSWLQAASYFVYYFVMAKLIQRTGIPSLVTQQAHS